MAEQIAMGIGNLGFRNLIFKRKFRFTFELFEICGSQVVPRHFVKVASRPQLTIDEVEINFLNARTWLPGKAYWNTMSVTYIDVATADAAPLYSWLATLYNFTDPVQLQMGEKRSDYTAVGVIKIWDGCGFLLETWEMQDVWPTDINFGDLDYASSDEVTIDLTMRYSNIKYTPECPNFPINPCCSGCDPEEDPNAPSTPQDPLVEDALAAEAA